MATQKPVFIGFYTVNTPYEEEAKGLRKSLEAFGLAHDIVPVEGRGSWVKNTQIKSEVIRDMLKKYDGRPIVYLDSDARVEQYPILFEEIDPEVEFAVHLYGGREVASGTLYFSNSENCKELVRRWITKNEEITTWDQKTLQDVLSTFLNLRWMVLPEEYCYIVDLALTRERPVIKHLQASRRLKRVINAAK